MISKPLFIAIIMTFSIPLIALIDYAIFSKWVKCEYCHKRVVTDWRHYILPCTIEGFFLLFGIIIGYMS